MSRNRTLDALGIALTAWLLGGVVLDAQTQVRPVEGGASARIAAAMSRRPLAWEANRGQTDPQVSFLARGDGYVSFLTPDSAVLALRTRDGAESAVRLSWPGSRPMPRITGEEPLSARTHYMRGQDPSRWLLDVPTYAKVRYTGLYPGVDLVFYGRPGEMEYDFVLQPGTDPGRVRLAVDGADRLSLDATGDLIARLGAEEVRFRRPVSYQEVDGVRREVASRYLLLAGGEVGFAVGPHDPARPLVIDPVLIYSTYLGGSFGEYANAVTLDAVGDAFVTGFTSSPDFPSTNGRPAIVTDFYSQPFISDAFVTMLDPGGNIIFSTYLGTEYLDEGKDVIGIGSGVYVVGISFSDDGTGGWIAGLDYGGFPIFWHGLGDGERSAATGVAADAAGHVYVSGYSFYGSDNAWAAKLSGNGTVLYFTDIDGIYGLEEAYDIAVDSAGNAYVTGLSSSIDFPVAGGFQDTLRGGEDAFLVKLDPAGTIVYSTLLGGSGPDAGHGIALGADGDVYLTGTTWSTDFPTVHPVQAARRGSRDAFVARIHLPDTIVYSTYLGGSDDDQGEAIAADPSGIAHLAGTTSSPDFPLRDPIDAVCAPLTAPGRCKNDAFVTRLTPQGALADSTYLGGSGEETGEGVAASAAGETYVAGKTESSDFPTANASQGALRGWGDAFVARISSANRPPVCAGATASPSLLWPPNGKLVPVSIQGVTDPDGDRVTISLTGITQDEPLTRGGTPDASGLGTAQALVRADRAGNGDGRVYRLSFTATDTGGASCAGAVAVCVPHDQRPGAACGDSGARIDSSRP